jgi:F-type H+-transporting ATPase subunit delta
MSTSRIARRYARALFRVTGGDLSKAKRQHMALRTLDALFANPDANRVLSSPVMPADLKRSLLEYGLKQTESDIDLDHLIRTIVDSGRAALVPEISTAFGELIDEAEGVVKASIISAVPLPEVELQEIGSAVSALLHKRAEVDAKVDPALLGGFQIRVGQYLIDLSLKTKLDGLSQRAAVDSLR